LLNTPWHKKERHVKILIASALNWFRKNWRDYSSR